MKNIEREFQKIHIEEHECARGNRFFDPIRNTFIPITPEEIVRQRMIVYLQEQLLVPAKSMRTEDHLAHHGLKDKDRMDIAIMCMGKRGSEKVLAVVECKNERIEIKAQQVINQAYGYATRVGAEYFILVNGVHIVFYHMEDSSHYKQLDGILTYDEMLCGKRKYAKQEVIFRRFSYKDYSKIWKLKLMNKYWFESIVGADTNKRLVPFIYNFNDCLRDTTETISALHSNRFTLLSDLGIQYRRYANASGANFGTGYYRVFLVKDQMNNYQFLVGFSIMSTAKTHNDPKFGNETGKSVLLVIYNDGEKDETAAQINLNRFLNVNEDTKTATITHNGAYGKRGLTKDGLFAYISKYSDVTIENETAVLGTVDYNSSLTMQSKDIEQLVSNLIMYAVARNEYKNQVKS